MPDKTAYHPNGKNFVRFREQNHTYIDNYDQRYVSGTTFLKQFAPKFDTIAVSKECAAGTNPKYAGRYPGEIREEWAAEGKRGRDEGNNIHDYAEFSGPIPKKGIKPISDRCEKIFKQVDYAFEMFRKKSFIVLDVEKIIFSPGLGIAGMIDIVIYDPYKCEIIIGDWKNNKNELITHNNFQSYHEPVSHLQDTDISKFSLQLSLYQYIIERERYFSDIVVRGYRRVIIHVGETFAKPVQLEYYDYEIKELLKQKKEK